MPQQTKQENLRTYVQEYASKLVGAYNSIIRSGNDVFVCENTHYTGRGLFDSQVRDIWHFLLPIAKRRVSQEFGVTLLDNDYNFIQVFSKNSLLHKFPISHDKTRAQPRIIIPEQIDLATLLELNENQFSFQRQNL
jgi:hypothetical protein